MASPQQTQGQAIFQRYVSDLRVFSFLGRQGVFYYVESSIYKFTPVHRTLTTLNITLYKLSPTGTPTRYNGTIQVNASAFNITVYTDLPQLARVVVNGSPGLQVVWAGLSGGGKVGGYSYVNGTATVELQFINGSSMATVEVPLNLSSGSSTERISLTLIPTNASVIYRVQRSLSVQFQEPRRYAPLIEESQTFNSSTFARYNATVAYFNGTYVPALEWRGEGIGSFASSVHLPGILGESFSQSVVTGFTTLEFFGVNGTSIGYIHLA
ncbi:hypothetical protein GCM10007116_22550 [Sulfodiicoccus acidiphilus]|nr:hypothetical protein [Sulfodiicoccus acidiphilus]GGU05712.1 hypothetical protein GCM10007116_22550 [Sulfodiicoccus acidiphilus]